MKLGLTYDRDRTRAPRWISGDVVRELRPDVLRLTVASVQELADRSRDLERLRVSAVVGVPLERWNAGDQLDAAGLVAGCRWIVGVELGIEPRTLDVGAYLEAAAGFAEQLHLASGQRLAVLNLGAVVEDVRAEGRLEDLAAFLASGEGAAPLLASMLAAHLAGVRVSAVGERWPSMRRAGAVVDQVRTVFGVPIQVEIGYALGAELTWLESARAWLLQVVETRRWLAWSARPRTLTRTLLAAWIRAAWSHWSRAGAVVVFLHRHLEPAGAFNAYEIGEAWRALRLASRPGIVGERWTAAL